MDSFDDQNFGHILSDLTSSNGSKELLNLPVPFQEAADEIDMPDHKILTPLEIPKSKSQLNFCVRDARRKKSLTEKLKGDDPREFPLTEFEPTELIKNLYSEPKNDRFFIPDSTTPAISAEMPNVTEESKIFEDAARQEILACLSDITPPPSADCSSSNIDSEIAASLPDEKLDKPSDISEEETKITRPRFFQQKSNLANSAKRKADDSNICVRPAKQKSVKSVSCLYYPGMIIWAKITGYSYWPAMIDNDPDVNAYTWPNDSSNNFVSIKSTRIIPDSTKLKRKK